MSLDSYAPCPCGSGKKFKWCCQPIHIQISEAFEQDEQGQHEAALRIMKDLVAQNPTNPEAWGRQAQLLYQNDRIDEAESALQKALEINPSYPFGILLQGLFRQNEGEIVGALALFRRAADLYDPDARDHLGQVYSLIAQCELKLNRPVAAHAALKIALHCLPSSTSLREMTDQVFGKDSQLPASASRDYPLQSAVQDTQQGHDEIWQRALAEAATGRLTDAARLFANRTEQRPDDPAAWYNRGLSAAWLGLNQSAIEALDRYVDLEPNEGNAAAAWALAEVLRCGQGMESHADYLEHWVLFQMREPDRVVTLLQQWEAERRLIALKTEEKQGFLSALILDQHSPSGLALANSQVMSLGAYVLLFGDRLRLWHTSASALARIRDEIRERGGPALVEMQAGQTPVNFYDVLAESLAFPVYSSSQEEAKGRVQAAVQRYFEETWIHRPLHSLNLIPPLDAAGHAPLRKKLRGVIRFLEECAAPTQAIPYDFDRLRRKLGLNDCKSGAAGAATPTAEIASMSAAELAALKLDELGDDDLETAYQAALKLDARELARSFVAALVGRPVRSDRPDHYPWYGQLVQMAIADGQFDDALDYVNQGEKSDCEHNEGRRRNDYELRRGQVHLKRGEVETAREIFERLIERAPAELRYRGTAAEALLSAKQPGAALRIAEQALVKARERNDRDSEDYFEELVTAAQKQNA
jgi:tetratricopeptide (TPR) repeat protein